MRDPLAVITYARAAEILGCTNGALRVMVHRGKFTKPKDCAGIGCLLEVEVLELERVRRVAPAPLRRAG